MRLLNTSSLELKEFWDEEIPQYAILSHTWGKYEVSFREMQNGAAKDKAGLAKIKASCKIAARHKLSYIWIDTCCIDKTSSAELTEAINCMYQWYKKADTCIAHLADVSVLKDGKVDNSAFAKSRWFTRGWTLQELIAPSRVIFYSNDWKAFGTKSELKEEISKITGISVHILEGQSPQSASVAARMFWASKRITTRVEDIAYCLMGLFDVNMPLLYGEREKAFIRLQEEIMKNSDDHSLFAWKAKKLDGNCNEYFLTGLLANSPVCFIDSGNIVPTSKYTRSVPFAISNLGLRIELVLVPDYMTYGLSIAMLDCLDSRDLGGPIGIRIKQLDRGRQFARIYSDTLSTVPPEHRLHKGLNLYSIVLYVRQRWEAIKIATNEYAMPRHRIIEDRPVSPIMANHLPPVYASISPQNLSTWSFGLKSIPPFASWTPWSPPS